MRGTGRGVANIEEELMTYLDAVVIQGRERQPAAEPGRTGIPAEGIRPDKRFTLGFSSWCWGPAFLVSARPGGTHARVLWSALPGRPFLVPPGLRLPGQGWGQGLGQAGTSPCR
jgi:hypothetical protein